MLLVVEHIFIRDRLIQSDEKPYLLFVQLNFGTAALIMMIIITMMTTTTIA
jgi:hypothetical protein